MKRNRPLSPTIRRNRKSPAIQRDQREKPQRSHENMRRVALIRKSSHEKLTTEETAELRQLQSDLEQRLSPSDDQLLSELTKVEETTRKLTKDAQTTTFNEAKTSREKT